MTVASDHPGPLFAGVDGGGTGCRARIEDANGCLLGAGIAGPAALRIGIDRALAQVEKACRAALRDAALGPCGLAALHAAVGLAGLGRKGAIKELVLRPHRFGSVVYADDATIACIGAHGSRDGGIVIVGTGSVGFALVGGKEIRIAPASAVETLIFLRCRQMRPQARIWFPHLRRGQWRRYRSAGDPRSFAGL